MDSTAIIAIVALALIAVIVLAVVMMGRKRKSGRLRERFGSEYERGLAEGGSRGEVEQKLGEREKRVEKLQLREIQPEQRIAFDQAWNSAQAHFVDDPGNAIREADSLVQRVMDSRGYPMAGFEQQAEDISVDHASVVTNYRAAHSIAVANDEKPASTEDLRQAMIHYRELFAELLGAAPVA